MKDICTPGGMYGLEVPLEEQLANMKKALGEFAPDFNKEMDSTYFPNAMDVLNAATEKWKEITDDADGQSAESHRLSQSHR